MDSFICRYCGASYTSDPAPPMVCERNMCALLYGVASGGAYHDYVDRRMVQAERVRVWRSFLRSGGWITQPDFS